VYRGAFIFSLQILLRTSYAQLEMGGVSGDTVVQMKGSQHALARNLKKGDVIMGQRGKDRTPSECTVISVVEQGKTELAGNFSFSHMLYDKKKIATQAKKEPSIVGLQDLHSYEVLTDCELVKAETPNGVEYFTPLSSAFCSSSSMSWFDYHILFGTLAEIMTKTGPFWIDIKNYNDCTAGPACTVPSWKDALPPICNAMLQCAKNKKQATCNTLNTLSHAFVKEHLSPGLQSKFTGAYPTFGKAVMDRDVPENGGDAWWKFWKWGIWSMNFDIDWRNPWVISLLVSICIAINAFIAVCVWQFYDRGDQYSYESFGSGEYGTYESDRDYEDRTATRTQTATYDDHY